MSPAYEAGMELFHPPGMCELLYYITTPVCQLAKFNRRSAIALLC